MPLTFLRYFYFGATLRWDMSTVRWPEYPLYDEMVAVFRSTFGDVMKGTWVANALPTTQDNEDIPWSFDPQQSDLLPDDIYSKLLDLVNAMPSPIRFSHINDAFSAADLPSLLQTGRFVRTIKYKNLIYAVPGRATRN